MRKIGSLFKDCSGERTSTLAKPDPMLLSFKTLYQPTVLQKWWLPKLTRFCLSRPPPKINLKDAWQVQHEDSHQRVTSTGKLVADEENMEPQNGFQNPRAVEPEQDDRMRLIGSLVHQVKNHPNKNALIADLQSNHPYDPFSEGSKEIIHDLGNVVECFELCEISHQIQCAYCLEYLAEGMVYCTCGTRLIPT